MRWRRAPYYIRATRHEVLNNLYPSNTGLRQTVFFFFGFSRTTSSLVGLSVWHTYIYVLLFLLSFVEFTLWETPYPLFEDSGVLFSPQKFRRYIGTPA